MPTDATIPRERMAELTCWSGPLAGRRLQFAIDAEAILGRSEGVALRVPDASISRQHCRFEPAGGGSVRVIDLNSSNGTRVNGQPATNRPLADGDRIQCGNVEIVFRYLRPPGPAAANWVDERRVDLSVEVGADLEDAIRQRFVPSLVMYQDVDTAEIEEAWAVKGINAVCGLAETLRLKRNPDAVLDATLDVALAMTHTERAAAVLRDREDGELRVVKSKTATAAPPGGFPVSLTAVKDVMEHNESLLIRDALDDERFKDGASIVSMGIRSILCVPLGDENHAFGALYVDTTSGEAGLTQDHLSLLAAIGHQAGVSLERSWLVDDLQRLFAGAMHAMVKTLEAKDAYTRGHTARVMLLALQLADAVGIDPDGRDALELGGLMHDVGKIGVIDSILGKPGRLTDDEYAVIKQHPGIGAAILGGMPNLERLVSLTRVIEAVRSHHERLDGKGYPDGLAGNAVPRSARLLAIADVWDALTTDRPYRNGLSTAEAWTIMEKGKGTQFDPELLVVFKDLVDRGATDDLSAVPTRFGLENSAGVGSPH